MVGNKSSNCCGWFVDNVSGRSYWKDFSEIEEAELKGFGVIELELKQFI
jgi:hypothetical protein